MLELIPSLFAQQNAKAALNPAPSIEPALTQAKSIPIPVPAAEQPAIAAPEPMFTPLPTPSQPATTIQGVSSSVALPQVPTLPETVTQPAPSAAQPTVTPLAQPATIATPQPTVAPLVTPRSTASTTTPKPALSSTRTVAPASTKVQATTEPSTTSKPAPSSAIEQQKQLLEQRLADIVSKDRTVKQAQQRDSLVNQAYGYATQRRFAQARRLLQDPSIPADLRDQVLSNINSLESASRTIGVTPVKEPTPKPAKPTKLATATVKPPTVFTGITSSRSRSQQTITIQVPQPIQTLPIQRKPQQLAAINEPTAPPASDAAGGYVDRMVTPQNILAYNRNLPKLNPRDQILYPLPAPVPVTSGFGWRTHPVTGARRFHSGIDLGAGYGTPVIASQSGKVTVADRLGGYGLAIVLEKTDGTKDTLYAHLSQIYVRPGERIQPGTIIGRVGSTGLSTGPHLHYEARRMGGSGWVVVDPAAQLEAARIRLVQAKQNSTSNPPS